MSAARTADEEAAWIRSALQRHADDTGRLLSVGEIAPLGVGGNESISTLFSVSARGRSGEEVPLVVKLLPPEDMQCYSSVRHMYRNEYLVYGSFLPFLVKTAVEGRAPDALDTFENLFPKFHHAHEEDSQCLLLLENLAPSGYKLAPKVLDLAHVQIALRELGRFHALSYIAKKTDPEAFSRLAKRLHPWDEKMCHEFASFVTEMTQVAVETFRVAHPSEGEEHAHRLAKLDTAGDFLYKLTVPEEPLAVLCHGDYNRNNVMFKYDEDGRPSSMKIIDFQLTTYSSPAIDLSLLLFLSILPEVLDANWDALFATYRSSLLDTMERSLRTPRVLLEKEYSIDALMKDFRKFCLHGFTISAFYMPVTLLNGEEFAKFEKECPPINSEEFLPFSKAFKNKEADRRITALFKILIARDIL